MDLDQLKQLLDLVREHGFSEFEIESEGLHVKLRKDGTASPPGVANPAPAVPAVVMPAPLASAPTAMPAPSAPAAASPTPAEPADTEVELAVVKSPIVGTFYRSPEPGAAAFVEIGASVKKGQVLCIIEAMKLMNEITSEYDGEIATVYVDNGKPVQYGERLFAIKTTDSHR